MTDGKASLTRWILGGFCDAAEALERLADDAGAHRMLALELERDQRAREQSWAELTVNDRIDEAFRELESRELVALQDAGFTQDEGWADARACADGRSRVRGAVFFHARTPSGRSRAKA